MQKHAVAVNARATSLELDVDHVEKVGKLLITTATPFGGVPVAVCVPAGLISELALIAANTERDPNLLRHLTYKATQFVGKAKVPEGERPLVAVTAVALAMVTNLSVEIDANHTIQNRFGWQFTALRSLLRFEPLRVWSLWKVALQSMFILAPPLVLTFVQHNGEVDIIAWLVGIAIWLLFISCGWGAVRLSRAIASYSTARWATWYRGGYATYTPLFSIPSNEERLLPGSDNIRAPAIVSDLTRIVLRQDTRSPGALPVTRAHIAGLVADTAVVNVSEPTQESELSAVTHRIGRENGS